MPRAPRSGSAIPICQSAFGQVRLFDGTEGIRIQDGKRCETDTPLFYAFLGRRRYAAGMERLVAIDGELIRVGPGAAPIQRRRLLVERLSDGAERIGVRVTALSPVGCSISGPGNLADVDGRLWLKFPGFEAVQVAAIDEEAGKLLCRFAQPLSSAFLNALANPRSQLAPNHRYQARCTLL